MSVASTSALARSAPSSPVGREPFAFPDKKSHRRTRSVQVNAWGELSWTEEPLSDPRSRPPRSPLTSVHRPATLALAPISEEHKEQRAARPRLPPYTPSSLGPRRLPPVDALDYTSSNEFGIARRRERPAQPTYATPPPISTPKYQHVRGGYPETPSPRTPSPPVTPETPDIDTQGERHIHDLQRQFAKQLGI